MRKLMFLVLQFAAIFCSAQFAPPAGQAGSTAIFQDSSVFTSWATKATISRGWQNSMDPSLGMTTIGDSLSCLGKADLNVASLGDRGAVILEFDYPIFDGPSWDFAVFENSFLNNFLELAFVEVSSDGINYHRFPCASLTQDTMQLGNFNFIEATDINNLAGKYQGKYGTPFDISELEPNPTLDINNISHIKIIDVVGSINDIYGSNDTAGNYINDPWPTPFASGGFDLDAVGVIHSKGFALEEIQANFKIYPNPSNGFISVSMPDQNLVEVLQLRDMDGQLLKTFELQSNASNSQTLDLRNYPSGTYVLEIIGSQIHNTLLLTIL